MFLGNIARGTHKINSGIANMANRTIRVLLLEDNENVSCLMTTLMESRGYEVVKFASAAVCPLQKTPECTCSTTSRCADIIISDLGMPFVSGIEFIRNQRHKQCKAPYMAMMSGSWQADEITKAENLGCKIFKKPFHISEINEWLDEVEQEIDLNSKLVDDIFENSGGT
jgi:DNA-binding response OmpR family regulator